MSDCEARDAGGKFRAMSDRESWLPLIVGAVVAVMLHFLFLPAVLTLNFTSAQRNLWQDVDRIARLMPRPPQIKIGNITSAKSAVAWISYEDFRELVARQGPVEQPAIQQQVDPLPDSNMPINPTPLGPQPQEILAQSVTAASISLVPPSPLTAGDPQHVRPLSDAIDGGLSTMSAPAEEPTIRSEPVPHDNVQHQQSAAQAAAAASMSANPTAAPRGESESPPVMLTAKPVKVRPGNVVTVEGLQINTVIPRPSLVVQLSTIPRNPTARLTFAPSGQVIKVRLERSTGYEGWDGPIEASLYAWHAAGPKLAELTRNFEISVNIMLHDMKFNAPQQKPK